MAAVAGPWEEFGLMRWPAGGAAAQSVLGERWSERTEQGRQCHAHAEGVHG